MFEVGKRVRSKATHEVGTVQDIAAVPGLVAWVWVQFDNFPGVWTLLDADEIELLPQRMPTPAERAVFAEIGKDGRA